MEPTVFFDGRSSRRHIVTLAFNDRLEIADLAAPDGPPLAVWSYDAMRRVDSPEGALRLACTMAPPLARLELRDPAEQDNILRLCGSLDGPGSAAPISVRRIVAASIAAAAAIIAMAWFGMPVLANRLAAVMPYSWEKSLGGAVGSQVLSLFGNTCAEPKGTAALRKLLRRLQTVANLPIPPDPEVLRSTIANAFALPGGRIYVLSGLLKISETPDELAGVIAHEMGHAAHRDSTRTLVESGGLSLLFGMLLGDFFGGWAMIYTSKTILQTSYSRKVESAADAYSVRCDASSMTQSDIDAGRVIATIAFTASQPIQQITVTLALTQAGVGPSQEAA